MLNTKATIVLGAILSSGMLMAQAPANSNPDTSLSAQSAPQNSTQAAPQQGMGRHHEMNPNKQAHHLAKALGLSKDQVQQIKPILADRDTQMTALRGDQSASQDDRRAKMMKLRTDTNDKINAVLTDDQKAEFKKMNDEMAARMGGGGAPPQ